MDTVYKAELLDHYRNPRNRGDPSGCRFTARGRNPRCGDDVEIGANFDGETLSRVRFRGRGCSICIAAASMMTATVTTMDATRARDTARQVRDWFDGTGDTGAELPESLRALAPVREIPARRRCVLLAWDALDTVLDAHAAES